MQHTYFLAVDVGTSSTKTALWTEEGVLVAQATDSYSLQRPCPSWAEMSALDWWKAACLTIQQVLAQAGIDGRQVSGVGVDGLGWTLVPVIETASRCAPP